MSIDEVVEGARRHAPNRHAIALHVRVLEGDFAAAQLWFDQKVLDRYRDPSVGRVMRTNTIGRIRSRQGWSIDFGIADEEVIHASAGDLASRLPVQEREHWSDHLIVLPTSSAFAAVRSHSGHCVDDGDLRAWPTLPAP
jgi:hypothetical protein